MVVLALGVVQKQHCRAQGWTTPDQFFHACYSDLPLVYEASGLRAVYLGDEAIVDCTAFTLAGGERKSLRKTVNRIVAYGYTTTFHTPGKVPGDVRAQIDAFTHLFEEAAALGPRTHAPLHGSTAGRTR